MPILFSWENADTDFGVALDYDRLSWIGTPKNDPRGGGETRQEFEAFQRDSAPQVFEAPARVLEGLRHLITSGAWKQIEQWEYCEITVDQRQGNGHTTVTWRAAEARFERHPGIDPAVIARLRDQALAEGWDYIKTFDNGRGFIRHDFKRRWRP